MDPAMEILSIPEPGVRTRGRRHVMAACTDIICIGACGDPTCVSLPHSVPLASVSFVSCKLCNRPLGHTVYMYMDMAFCTPECRYESFLDVLYEERRKVPVWRQAIERARRSSRAEPRVWLHTEDEDRSFRRIFFD